METILLTKSIYPRRFKTAVYSKVEAENRITKEHYLKKLDFSVFQSGNKINTDAIEYVTKYLKAKTTSDSAYQLGVLSQQISRNLASPKHSHFAFHCFNLAAQEGHAAAQCKLGEIYINGLDATSENPAIQQDIFLASSWLKEAINQDNAKAKYLYAEHFLKPGAIADEFKDNNEFKTDASEYQRLLDVAARSGYAVAALKFLEVTKADVQDQVEALLDVVLLYEQGNEYLRVEPDLTLHRHYSEQYNALVSKLKQT